MLQYAVARNLSLGMSMGRQKRSRRVIRWIPSSVSMVHLLISAPTIPMWKKAKLFYRSFSSTTSPLELLSHVSHNRTLINGAYKSIIRGKIPSLTQTVLPDMCGCIKFCYGLVYLTVWLELPINTSLLRKLTSEPPLT